MANSASVDSWIAKTIEKFGKLDGGANWAGVIRVNPIVQETDENWDFVMGVNAKGVFNCVRAQLRVMKDGASIVSRFLLRILGSLLADFSVSRFQLQAQMDRSVGRRSQLIAPVSMPLLA